MSPHISIDQETLAEFCRKHYIKRLAIFGSALRDDFRPDSDVDVLVEGLHAIAAGQYERTYELDARTGEYVPSGWLPQYEAFFSATHAERRSPRRRMADSRRASSARAELTHRAAR